MAAIKIKNRQFTKKYTFCTLVTRRNEYDEMVKSAELAGFCTDDVEFIYFDNINENLYDGFSGINEALKVACGQYLIFCHQDIVFNFDNREILDKCIEDVEKKDINWAVLGNAGRTVDGRFVIRISDPHGENISIGIFPEEVMSLDENFLILNRKLNLSASYSLRGFHLYGLDICRNANFLGYSNYVINFHLTHKSGGKIDESFIVAQNYYMNLEHRRKNQNYYVTTCTNFYTGSNKFFNSLLKIRIFFKIYKKIKGYK